MEQLAEPVASVVPLQLWAEPPEPERQGDRLAGQGVAEGGQRRPTEWPTRHWWPWWPRCR